MDPEAGGGQPSGQNSPILFDLLGMGNGTGFADPEDATGYFNAPFYFADNLDQYQGQFLGPPRTYGVTLRANF